MSEDERLLIKLCKQGNLTAYDNLMRLYEKKVYALCYRMSGNHADAQDLAQETFLKAFRSLPSFKGESQFATWLYRIAANTCLDERRKKTRKPLMLSLDKPLGAGDVRLPLTLPDTSNDPLSETLSMELQTEIQDLLNRMPAEQRAMVVMRDLEGLSYEEIARALGMNMGTVKSKLNRARRKLRELYLKNEEQIAPSSHLKKKEGGLSHDL